MAMKPFCGYNFGDYWQHWLSFADKSNKLPKIFHVNWFRRDKEGKFMWPGFGDNLRVLRWILDRANGRCTAKETALGFIPNPGDLDTQGLSMNPQTLSDLCSIKNSDWISEWDEVGKYLASYGDHLPPTFTSLHSKITAELES